jgi:hypothetical protein
MKMRVFLLFSFMALTVVAIGAIRVIRERAIFGAPKATYLTAWSPKAAATYLDSREVWWQSWPTAQKDHGTICVSCHTVVPYALVRSSLRQQLGEKGITATEKTMLESVEKRVTYWSEMTPFYSDAEDGPGKTAQSHSTEAVLNAVILASYDTDGSPVSPAAHAAFDEAWALQETNGEEAGGWKWQDFGLAPWESRESAYQGSAQLAIAFENTPGNYNTDPATANHVEMLRAYLQRLYPTQPLMSQLYALWASARMPGIVSAPQRAQLLSQMKGLQRGDGGWTLFSLDEQTSSKLLGANAESDGCATGLVVLAMEESGVKRGDAVLEGGLKWLEHHQQSDGSWRDASLNAQRNPGSDIGRFMTDAATGYATLALEVARDN